MVVAVIGRDVKISPRRTPMSPKKVAVIVGSLRKESFNRKMANNLIKLAPENLRLELLEISQLSMYNQDLDENPPKDWVDFKNNIQTYDGVIFVTPEYNRSIPGVLKNALDVGSRPYGKSAWDKKPAAVMSVSPGATGGFGANQHLRQCLVFLNMPAMQQPEAYIGNAAKMFNDSGEIIESSTREFVSKFLKSYSEFLTRFTVEQTQSSATRERSAPEAAP